MPIEKTIEEPKEVLLVPAIPGTLKFHKIIRKYNIRNICYLEFFNRSYQGIPTFKQFDRKDDDSGICDHMYVDVDNHTYCLNPYWKFETQEWLECSGCCNSCFFLFVEFPYNPSDGFKKRFVNSFFQNMN